MQAIAAFFTALLLMLSSFFTALPHIFRLDSQTPEQSITDVEEVLALYQGIAAKNEGIKLREGNSLRTGTVMQGMPGVPEAITADDLASANAAYYRDGKTLVISLVPNLDEDPIGAAMRVIGDPYSYIMIYSIGYVQPSHAEIVVDAQSGKIVAADYTLTVRLVNVGQPEQPPQLITREYKLP